MLQVQITMPKSTTKLHKKCADETTHPLVANVCLKCREALMRVAKQKRRMAVSSNWRTMVPLMTLMNRFKSFDAVKVLDIEVNIVLISCRRVAYFYGIRTSYV